VGGQRRPGGLLWQRSFRLLWLGETISQLGNAIAVVGVPLIAVIVQLAGGASALAAAFAGPGLAGLAAQLAGAVALSGTLLATRALLGRRDLPAAPPFRAAETTSADPAAPR
jgi:hypothetical protein